MIAVGDAAPDFTLRDQNNEDVTLSSYRGSRAVLIIFYPLAFTGICTRELDAVRDDTATFRDGPVEVLTISVDSSYSNKIFAEREKYEFRMLSDFWPHGAVAREYGVFNEVTGFANRGTFLVDVDGVVRFAELNSPGEGRDPQRWREAVNAL